MRSIYIQGRREQDIIRLKVDRMNLYLTNYRNYSLFVVTPDASVPGTFCGIQNPVVWGTARAIRDSKL
jgi:hypothetical protein